MKDVKTRRTLIVALVTATLFVPGAATADEPGEPPPVEALEEQAFELAVRVQDLTLAAGNHCRTGSDWNYFPQVTEDVDGEILNWAVFILWLDYCFTVHADGSRTMYQSGPARCEGRDGNFAEYQGCQFTVSPSISDNCAYVRATGEFTWNGAPTWSPEGEVQRCV